MVKQTLRESLMTEGAILTNEQMGFVKGGTTYYSKSRKNSAKNSGKKSAKKSGGNGGGHAVSRPSKKSNGYGW